MGKQNNNRLIICLVCMQYWCDVHVCVRVHLLVCLLQLLVPSFSDHLLFLHWNCERFKLINWPDDLSLDLCMRFQLLSCWFWWFSLSLSLSIHIYIYIYIWFQLLWFWFKQRGIWVNIGYLGLLIRLVLMVSEWWWFHQTDHSNGRCRPFVTI